MRHFGITIQNIENIGRKQTWNVSCRHKIYKKKNRRYFHTQNSSTCVECVCNASQTVHRINKKIERNNIIVNKRTKIKKKTNKKLRLHAMQGGQSASSTSFVCRLSPISPSTLCTAPSIHAHLPPHKQSVHAADTNTLTHTPQESHHRADGWMRKHVKSKVMGERLLEYSGSRLAGTII